MTEMKTTVHDSVQGTPIIEIQPGRYFEAFWFVGNADGDWLCALYTDGPEDDWHLVYRFRYTYDAVTDPLQPSKDAKNVYRATSPKSAGKNDILRAVALVAAACELRYGNRVVALDVRTDDCEKIAAALRSQKWAHMAEMTGRRGVA